MWEDESDDPVFLKHRISALESESTSLKAQLTQQLEFSKGCARDLVKKQEELDATLKLLSKTRFTELAVNDPSFIDEITLRIKEESPEPWDDEPARGT